MRMCLFNYLRMGNKNVTQANCKQIVNSKRFLYHTVCERVCSMKKRYFLINVSIFLTYCLYIPYDYRDFEFCLRILRHDGIPRIDKIKTFFFCDWI